MKLKKRYVYLFSLALLSLPATIGEQKVIASNQNKVQEYKSQYSYNSIITRLKNTTNQKQQLKLIDQAIAYNYWNKPNFKTSPYNNEEIINLYRKALNISPNSSKYLLGLSAIYQMDGQMEASLNLVKKALELNPNDYQALMRLAIYEKFNNQNDTFQKIIKRMNQINYDQTQKLNRTIEIASNSADMTLNTNADQVSNHNHPDHYIVILALMLTEQGQIQPQLAQRLNAGLTLAKAQPQAKIIVSGGKLPREPRIEAEVMKEWLIQHGIAAHRIITEKKSLDTTQNAINSTKLLEKYRARSMTLVTSASHMRRAFTLFQNAEALSKRHYSLNQYVAVDTPSALTPITKAYKDIGKIINDATKVSGYWGLPGIQR